MADKTEQLDFTDFNVSHVEHATSDLTCVSAIISRLSERSVSVCFLNSS